ncbi:MAG: hypothetical protein ABI603_06975 [Acidobacteriota bacterium]
MECRHCGTEIADKAIVCYRCGAGTSDPVRTPAPIGRRPGGGPPLVAGIVPLVAALILLVMARTSPYAEALTVAAAAAALAGVVLVVVRLSRRR